MDEGTISWAIWAEVVLIARLSGLCFAGAIVFAILEEWRAVRRERRAHVREQR